MCVCVCVCVSAFLSCNYTKQSRKMNCTCIWMCAGLDVCPQCLTSCAEERESPARTVVQAACLIIQLWPPHLFSSSLQSFLSGSHSFISVSLFPSLLSLLFIPAVPDPPCSSPFIYLSLFTCSHLRVTRSPLPTSIDLTFFFFLLHSLL